MRILIMAQPMTYSSLHSWGIGNHISSYHNFLHYDIWKEQGHDVKFYGQKIKIPSLEKYGQFFTENYNGYDMIFFRGYNSFIPKEFAVETLKNFKGKKILYLEGGDKYNIGQYFDIIFIPEIPEIYKKWKEKFPNKDIRYIAWTCPRFSLLDKNEHNPYKDDKFRIIYMGTLFDRYVNILKKLAEKGENIVIGGMYHGGKFFRDFTTEELNSFPENIEIINKGIFVFGSNFNYLKHADLGINFYPQLKPGCLSSKITEYLCCGLPIITECSASNAYRVNQCKAGSLVKWNNFNEIYEAVIKEKEIKRDKLKIKTEARQIHNPENICKKITKIVEGSL